MAQKKEPVHKFRMGRIRVSIWANQTRKGEVWFNVEMVRRWLNGTVWQDSNKFGRDDLPMVAKAADKAFAWIWDQESLTHSANVEQEEQTEPADGAEE